MTILFPSAAPVSAPMRARPWRFFIQCPNGGQAAFMTEDNGGQNTIDLSQIYVYATIPGDTPHGGSVRVQERMNRRELLQKSLGRGSGRRCRKRAARAERFLTTARPVERVARNWLRFWLDFFDTSSRPKRPASGGHAAIRGSSSAARRIPGSGGRSPLAARPWPASRANRRQDIR
jgi:hypothetical protein